MFNTGELCLDGIAIDINPITVQETGSLDSYLVKAEEYLDKLRIERLKELEDICIIIYPISTVYL